MIYLCFSFPNARQLLQVSDFLTKHAELINIWHSVYDSPVAYMFWTDLIWKHELNWTVKNRTVYFTWSSWSMELFGTRTTYVHWLRMTVYWKTSSISGATRVESLSKLSKNTLNALCGIMQFWVPSAQWAHLIFSSTHQVELVFCSLQESNICVAADRRLESQGF